MTSQVNDRARALVTNELRRRGAGEVVEVRENNRIMLKVTVGKGNIAKVIVKARTAGTWQSQVSDGDVGKAEVQTFWIFVDLENPARPTFFIVPDHWLRTDIAKSHEEYLARHGGRRAVSQESNHHAISLERIQLWRDRWNLIGL